MNMLMTRVVPFRRADSVLTGIEAECKEAFQNPEAAIDVFRGPFGAFRLALPGDPQKAASQSLIHIGTVRSPPPDFSNPESFQLPDWLETSSLFADYDTATPLPVMCAPSPLPTGYTVSNGPRTPSPAQETGSVVGLVSSTSILQDASHLLKHYVNHYIPSLTPFRHTKTPWHVLFLPSVKYTLAGLAIGEEVDAANLTTFFGTLSISAHHLHHHSSGQKWLTHATRMKEQAQGHIKFVLEHALDRPKLFKYKAVMMALLTMIQASVRSFPISRFVLTSADS